ncbi:AAA family ATPase [Spirosoma litoris]
MEDPIKYISTVEIKHLWNEHNIIWNLNQDVNILSGVNGSGKSTILDCIFGILFAGEIPDKLTGKVDSIKIVFNNGKYILFEYIQDTIKSLEAKAKDSNKFKNIISNLKEREGKDYKKIKEVSFKVTSFDNIKMDLVRIQNLIEIDVISTFDNALVESEAVTKLSNEDVKTELDWVLYRLQKKYLDYQLNLGKKAIEALSKKDKEIEDVKNISYYQEHFLNLVDELFKSTGKKINRDKNELTFLKNQDEIKVYDLSSGEKQILVILLTVLIQNNKTSILFMDEPEISLHFDWQKKLIENIRSLNPSVQIILATHSPAVVMEGWLDKVSEVSDLIELN